MSGLALPVGLMIPPRRGGSGGGAAAVTPLFSTQGTTVAAVIPGDAVAVGESVWAMVTWSHGSVGGGHTIQPRLSHGGNVLLSGTDNSQVPLSGLVVLRRNGATGVLAAFALVRHGTLNDYAGAIPGYTGGPANTVVNYTLPGGWAAAQTITLDFTAVSTGTGTCSIVAYKVAAP